MKGRREFRIIRTAEIRAKKGDKPIIEGYAAVFNEFYDNGWFVETIKSGAFTRAIKEKQDVRSLFNHDRNQVLGRTKPNTLRLSQDSKGLAFECDMPDTQLGRDVHALIDRGDIDGCSIGFSAVEQVWREEKKDNKVTVYRELLDLDLYDAGPVTFPAFEQTSVEARSLWPDGVPAEISEHIPVLGKEKPETRSADECQCDCAECEDGDCANCSNQDCSDPNCSHEDRSLLVTPEEFARLQLRVRQALA
jgi:HK97 family phage prohead protease